jgi:hypothetical protein
VKETRGKGLERGPRVLRRRWLCCEKRGVDFRCVTGSIISAAFEGKLYNMHVYVQDCFKLSVYIFGIYCLIPSILVVE